MRYFAFVVKSAVFTVSYKFRCTVLFSRLVLTTVAPKASAIQVNWCVPSDSWLPNWRQRLRGCFKQNSVVPKQPPGIQSIAIYFSLSAVSLLWHDL